MKKKALIAMSGGVDSSVAAYLMKEAGYECVGATMRLFEVNDEDTDPEKACLSKGVDDARKAADALGIPFHVIDLSACFREKVMNSFVDSYLRGMTPNPCVECNRCIKFGRLFQEGEKLGCDVIVTGHYVRISRDEKGCHLLKGIDLSKDQSYVLYSLDKKILEHTCFPLGSYHKEEVRRIAKKLGFVNADKQDSQDICFIPDGNYAGFIETVIGKKGRPGDFVNQQGEVVGRHKGYYCYTIGQRRGLGISGSERIYVTDIIPEENKVVLGKNNDLFRTDLIAGDFHWIDVPEEGDILKARIRYHQAEKECTVESQGDGKVMIHFSEAQRAITPGQSVVVYRGDMVMGGGKIMGPVKA